ncbi:MULTISPECIES: maleylpyruvate isomerase family mycothiol-dependent enzyme [Thermomonosporaceae]|uniref:maleylpyruvate isomerase family mycothiol-dependent enzyme n=1 Tax=Thermomonosporaceae TaxID=2012 RepID=UPI00255B2787|nr:MULTISPECIES: maleylpyruvate isomerase family mycothiol-dependent enzyme [Thermomonosporaceae]MDL4777205.1 maleylpyruvate isomerase family mycothiol-dependent enzyme [Actinomadura xylanilytica]
MDEWRKILDEIETGTERILGTLSKLTDEDLRGASALEGWTRGHVAVHIARNADSLWNLLEGARTGTEIPQYPSVDARNADLEAGAGRGVAELAADVRDSGARFAEQARTLPEAAWAVPVRAMAGWPHPAWYTMYRRWHEVEAHHVDLAAGYGAADWPEEYVRWALTSTLADLAARPPQAWAGLAGYRITATDSGESADLGRAEGGPEISGSGRALIGWLSGRTGGEGVWVRPDGPLPEPPPWPHEPSGF